METRRILLDGIPTTVERDGEELVAPDGARIPLGSAEHLPPTEPTKIVCVHLNYESRVKEFLAQMPPAPTYFHKPVSALNAHGGEVVRPPRCRYLNYEGEIAIVIGRTCAHIAPDDAAEHIAGYTVANDYGLHDFRDTDAGSMLRVKGSDTLCPLGPGLVDDWDFRGKRIRTLVNGDVRQDGSTDEMMWDMHYLVADIARTITLVPGRRDPVGDAGELPPGRARRRRRGRGRGSRHPAQPDRRGRRPDPRGRRRAAERVRGGRLDRVRRRLGVPRDPSAEEGLMDLDGPLRAQRVHEGRAAARALGARHRDEPFLGCSAS